MKHYFLIALLFLSISRAAGQAARSGAPAILQPCEVAGAEEGKKVKALCGSYPVFEDRRKKSGRRIALKILVFPATGKDKLPGPVFYFAGGPGGSATEDAPYLLLELAKVNERRDLVFIDQRGTGGSNPLNCDFFDPADPQSYMGHWNPPGRVRQCREKLEKNAGLRLYGTSIAMDDIDEVRKALGYKKINLFGGSYGTRAALEYIRRHGKNVRTAVLQGIAPSDQLMPRDFPLHTQRALDGVVDECLADEACRGAFPDLKASVKKVLERLLKGPVESEVKIAGKPLKLKLSRDLAAEAIRYMLYQSGSASRIPLIIDTAAKGGYAPLTEAAFSFRQGIVASGSSGMYLSITCSEDLPWIKPGEGERNAENTFLGDYRLRQQREGCELWPRSELEKGYAGPVRSDVPALIFSGQWDPVTPPLYGERQSKYMPNSLHLVVPGGGHGFGGLEGLECLSKLTSDFIESGSAKSLDASCVKTIRRKGFLLEQPEMPK